MRAFRILAMVLAAYIGIVVAFESLIGFFQPADDSTLVITTFDVYGDPHDRVVSQLETADALYVAANHWPRAWYNRALEHPKVEVTVQGNKSPYLAVRVTDAEQERVDREHSLPLVFRILTGFPPRNLIRLDRR
jgi:hypothetical protein